MTLDIVIPTYTLNEFLENVALRAIKSYQGQGKIIVVEDGGMFSKRIADQCDAYLWNKVNKGFTANVNRGWRYSTADFTAIVNSDTELVSGELKDLCVNGKVTSPEIINQNIEFLAGPFWVTPKEVKEERGILREEMRTYASDSEYDARVRDIFQKVGSVKIGHQQMQTVTLAGVQGGEELDRDRYAYEHLSKLPS